MPAYASKGVGRAGYDKPTAREPRSARKHLTNARHEACAHNTCRQTPAKEWDGPGTTSQLHASRGARGSFSPSRVAADRCCRSSCGSHERGGQGAVNATRGTRRVAPRATSVQTGGAGVGRHIDGARCGVGARILMQCCTSRGGGSGGWRSCRQDRRSHVHTHAVRRPGGGHQANKSVTARFPQQCGCRVRGGGGGAREAQRETGDSHRQNDVAWGVRVERGA